MKVLLQKMKFLDGGLHTYTCIVNAVQMGGEFTLCGCATDGSLRYEGFERDGEEFVGNLKDVTCPNCIKVVKYIKSIE